MSDNLPARTPTGGGLGPMAERFPILNPERNNEFMRNVQTNVGPRGLNPQDLERIGFPTGGNQFFTSAGLDGMETHRELTGIVIDRVRTRRYWRIPYAERGKKKSRPDCASKDGFWGVGDPGGECGSCPLAEFGSDVNGRGQACKEVHLLLFLRDGCNLPDIVPVPPTSIRAMEKYFVRLLQRNIPFWAVVSTIRLERVENQEGVAYAKMSPVVNARLTSEERAALRPFVEQMAGILRPLVVEAEVEAESESGGEEFDGGPREG